MATYTTVFLITDDEVEAFFPHAVRRLESAVDQQVVNPFTGESVTVQSWEPEASGADGGDSLADTDRPEVAPFDLPTTPYLAGLEASVPPLLKTFPHIALKSIEPTELGIAVLGVESPPDWFLHCNEDEGALMILASRAFDKLQAADGASLKEMAARWATSGLFMGGDAGECETTLSRLQQFANSHDPGGSRLQLCVHLH